jgi:hypothetical protein
MDNGTIWLAIGLCLGTALSVQHNIASTVTKQWMYVLNDLSSRQSEGHLPRYTLKIIDQSIKFLGKRGSRCAQLSGLIASSCLKSMFSDQLSSLDAYQIWILQHLMIPALHFHLMVNDLPKSPISIIQ